MPRAFVIYITWALQNLSLKSWIVSECGQRILLNIMMVSSKGAGGEMFCFLHSSCVLYVYWVFLKSGRMLSPFLPLIRKLTWVEVFDSTAVDITNFSRLLPLLRFHVSSPDIIASHPLCISCDTLKIYTRLSVPSLWYLWGGYLKTTMICPSQWSHSGF